MLADAGRDRNWTEKVDWSMRDGDRDREADRHWAAVSYATQVGAAHRARRWAARRHAVRVWVGLRLIRAGLVLAPLRSEDVALP